MKGQVRAVMFGDCAAYDPDGGVVVKVPVAMAELELLSVTVAVIV